MAERLFVRRRLLILTNNTRLADWLIDPDNHVRRVYLVTVRGRVSSGSAALLEEGVRCGGELLRARSVVIRKASERETHLVIELVEGKNREIRRLWSTIQHEVTRLRRVQFGELAIGSLDPGRWRHLTVDDLRRAFPTAPDSVLRRS
jgi:23S rRNA pseudouridine2605 synthase